jgi:tetratricopeptide (TPR) repeat protein
MKLRLIGVAMVVAALAVSASGCGRYSISNIRSLKAFQDANNLYKKGEYKSAIERYEASLKFNPELGFAYFFLGNSYDNLYKSAKKGDPANDANLTKAADNYRIAIQKMAATTDPKEKEIRNLAFQYLIAVYGAEKLDDFSKAEPIARELIAAEPDEPANYQALGRMYEDLGRYDEAEATFQKAIELRPKDGLGYQLLAAFHNRQGNFDKTMEAHYQRAAAEPNNPEAWHTIGGFYQDKVFREKKLPAKVALDYTMKGLEAEDKALQLNPEYFEALSFKNILLRQQALYEKDPAVQKRLITEAEGYYQKALEVQKKQNQGAATAAAAAAAAGKKGNK